MFKHKKKENQNRLHGLKPSAFCLLRLPVAEIFKEVQICSINKYQSRNRWALDAHKHIVVIYYVQCSANWSKMINWCALKRPTRITEAEFAVSWFDD